MIYSAGRLYLIFNFLFFSALLFSQVNPSLDDPYNNWDGISHWSKYMRFAPKYLGPNALPIPSVTNGTINENLELTFAAECHYNPKDITPNVFSKIEIPLVQKRINIEINVVPIEFYNMDSAMRIERRTLNKQGAGFAGGDIYIINHIQVLKDYKKFPNIALRMGLRTASGTHLSHARYTDAPGYFFDVSFGKKYLLRNNENYFKLYFSSGFYCWQTNDDFHRQNDAFMFAFGGDLKSKKMLYSLQTASYQGYINNGDKPWVIRCSAKSYFSKPWNFEVLLEQGINDFPYSSIRIGAVYRMIKTI